jgi:hypothetical protein
VPCRAMHTTRNAGTLPSSTRTFLGRASDVPCDLIGQTRSCIKAQAMLWLLPSEYHGLGLASGHR